MVHMSSIKPNFGLLFDIDGVLLRGSTPIPEALTAMHLLKGRDGKLRVPIAFVTNSCGNCDAKAEQLSSTFNIDVRCGKILVGSKGLHFPCRF